ncbi:MAG: hypothetical protein AAFN11_08065 [Chloroflexota bacterium]
MNYDGKRDTRDYRTRSLSASSKGRGIAVANTGSPGTLIHTALDSQAANEWDAIALYAVNNSGSAVKLTVEWGGTDTSDQIEMTIQPESGLVEIIPELVLQDEAPVRAFATTANAISLYGVVRRYGDSRK